MNLTFDENLIIVNAISYSKDNGVSVGIYEVGKFMIIPNLHV